MEQLIVSKLIKYQSPGVKRKRYDSKSPVFFSKFSVKKLVSQLTAAGHCIISCSTIYIEDVLYIYNKDNIMAYLLLADLQTW